MKIDWASWEEIRADGWSATHLDLQTGTFLGEDRSAADGGGDVEVLSAAGRRLTLWRGDELPELCSDSGRIERVILFDIADVELRRAALAAWQAIDDLPGTPFPSREDRKAERARRRTALNELLSKVPSVAARFHARHDWLARGELWSCLRHEDLRIDNPPPWLDDLAVFKSDLQRGWRALLSDCLGCIDGWLAAHAPGSHADLRPPATATDIDRLQARLPAGCVALPEAYRALYRWHDGTTHEAHLPAMTSLIFNCSLLSLDDALEHHAMSTALLRRGDFDDRPPTWWNERWLPFLSNGAGDLWCIDLTPAGGGRIVWFLHDDARRKVLFRDLGAFIEGYAEALSAGLWRVDPDDGNLEPTDWDAWERHCTKYGGHGLTIDAE